MVQKTIDDDALVQALFEVFRQYGYEGTTIALLSAATGLKKSSLYHRFPAGKADMAKAVVAHLHGQMQQTIIAPLLNTSALPEERFNQLLKTIEKMYAKGSKSSLLNVMSLGEVKPEMRQVLNTVYDALLYALERLAQEVGLESQAAKLWSERFLIFVEGVLVMQRLTKNKEMFMQQMQFEQQQFSQMLNKTP